jgi:hypothetical protein
MEIIVNFLNVNHFKEIKDDKIKYIKKNII